MRALDSMSIKWKQMLIIMLTSIVALLSACAIFVTYDVLSFRKEIVKRVSVLAEAVGNNCTGTIEFNDPKTAEETLSALRAETSIAAACIYTRKGGVFAAYNRPHSSAFALPSLQSAGHAFTNNSLYLFYPISQRGETIGTIFVASDLTDLRERLARYPAILGGMLAVSLMVALLLSSRLQRVVSNPILHLAQVARSVALDKNYSVRAINRAPMNWASSSMALMRCSRKSSSATARCRPPTTSWNTGSRNAPMNCDNPRRFTIPSSNTCPSMSIARTWRADSCSSIHTSASFRE